MIFLQSKIDLFVNRLDSVESVIPYEYARFVFITILSSKCFYSLHLSFVIDRKIHFIQN